MNRDSTTLSEPTTQTTSQMRARVRELEETLQAIRTGAVDALVVEGPSQRQVFTLQGAEQAYRVLVEAMNEGAVTLDRFGNILYCNRRFAAMADTPLEKVLGLPFSSFLAARETESFRHFFRRAWRSQSTMETTLLRADSELSVHLSANSLPLGGERGLCLVITDITERKAIEDAQRNLAKSIIQAQERERQRVALELHDGVNQLLASTKHRIHGIEQRLNGHGGELHEDVVQTRKLLERTIQEVRLISRNLRPSELDDLGLLAAIRTLASEFSTRSGITVDLKLGLWSGPLSAEIELTIYRIFQEALTNVERHSHASVVSILLTQTSRNVQLVIRDNGHGFDPVTAGKSRFGLANMYERASHVNGKCAIESSDKSGTTIRLRIPLAV